MKYLLVTAVFFNFCFSSLGQATKQPKFSFDKNKPFIILNSKRGITKQSSATDTLECKGWKIPKNVLPGIIKNSKSINGTELDLTFEVLPCIVDGQLKQNGQVYKFEINAGSWMYIYSSDSTIILGNFKKMDEKYFLVPPDK